MRHKYIQHSIVGFIIWPARNGQESDVSHLDMARITRRQQEGGDLVSAGFVWIGNGGAISVEGRSESLGLGPARDDVQELRRQLYGSV